MTAVRTGVETEHQILGKRHRKASVKQIHSQLIYYRSLQRGCPCRVRPLIGGLWPFRGVEVWRNGMVCGVCCGFGRQFTVTRPCSLAVGRKCRGWV